MKIIYLLINYIFMVATLTSCGNPFVKEKAHSELAMDPLRRAMIFNSQSVTCQSSDCPESIGKIVVAHNSGVGQCTGVLIKKNLFLTNGHCIPKKELKNYKDCSKNIYVLFPKTVNKFEQKVTCKKVLSYNNGKNRSDILLIELSESLNRENSNLDQRAFKDFEDLYVWKMTPRSGGHGIISKSNCKAIYNSLLTPEAIDGYYPIMPLADCTSTPGNSGSPVFTKEGKVISLMSGRFLPSYIHRITAGKTFSEPMTNFAKAENLVCANIFKSTHPECKKYDLSTAYRPVSNLTPINNNPINVRALNSGLYNRYLKSN